MYTSRVHRPTETKEKSRKKRLSNDDDASSDGIDVDDLVLVTVQGEGIFLYNVAMKRMIRSWAVPPSVTFACAAQMKLGEYPTEQANETAVKEAVKEEINAFGTVYAVWSTDWTNCYGQDGWTNNVDVARHRPHR